MLNWYKTKYFVPAIIWAILIWSLSTTSNLPPVPWNFLSADKVGHLFFYAVETLLLIGALSKSLGWTKGGNWAWILCCMIIAGFYGIVLEFVQATIPDRSFDYADMLANFAGTLVAAIFYYCTATKFFIQKTSAL
ncbi:VanZ family protein [Aureispira anguillae]|uniref:VanZ family protein n=1 Tax=Aureispira anguillae TaxID=2864201 RepID=A0A915VJY6_9BACT|nr:VanZ family protein [Aureispira anguillae]BDS09371.1 VanZ family protein [Aureispira anguillae]